MQVRYSILVFIAAAFWGLYWWPLREVEAGGIAPQWSVVAVYLIPFIALLPVIFFMRRSIVTHWQALLFIGTAAGAGLACYATAFLYTSVVRTVLLFYMMPVWATLLSIVFLKERTHSRRWLAMLIGFVGLSIMVYPGSTQASGPVLNIGDGIALLSGIFWGAGTVLIRRSPQIEPWSIMPAQYLFALLISMFLLITLSPAGTTAPDTESWLNAMPYLIGFYVCIVLPTLYICARGSQILSPGRIGILMMSEVLVAGISATLIAGETVSNTEWFAAALIIIAGLIEVTTPQDSSSELQVNRDSI